MAHAPTETANIWASAAAGLGDAPWKTAPSTHLYGVASHMVFGTVTEGVRRLLRGWMK